MATPTCWEDPRRSLVEKQKKIIRGVASSVHQTSAPRQAEFFPNFDIILIFGDRRIGKIQRRPAKLKRDPQLSRLLEVREIDAASEAHFGGGVYLWASFGGDFRFPSSNILIFWTSATNTDFRIAMLHPEVYLRTVGKEFSSKYVLL